MQGLYIHIPFCDSKCAYCGFYSIADKTHRGNYLQAVLTEASKRADEAKAIDTVYIGGGSPSVFSAEEWVDFFCKLSKIYNISQAKEITLEVNPEHLSQQPDFARKITENTPINRISMGVQSFNNNDLKFIGRKHSASHIFSAIEQIQTTQKLALSIDLIYGIPSSNMEVWKENLATAARLEIEHLSAYSLTIEPQTVFARKNIIIDEVEIEQQYDYLQEWCALNGFEKYETSNYARNGCYASHNLNYWNLSPYIGLGAGAHSYSGFKDCCKGENNNIGNNRQIAATRRWNINNVKQYLNNPTTSFEQEYLSEQDTFNEYIMTALRTKWGIQKETLRKFSAEIQKYFHGKANALVETPDGYILSKNDELFADKIAEYFFLKDS